MMAIRAFLLAPVSISERVCVLVLRSSLKASTRRRNSVIHPSTIAVLSVLVGISASWVRSDSSLAYSSAYARRWVADVVEYVQY